MKTNIFESRFRSKFRETLSRFLWKQLMFIQHPESYNIDKNGEFLFLKNYLLWLKNQSRELTIFDCGANRGHYSKHIYEISSKFDLPIDLYLFEPQQSLNNEIRQNLPLLKPSNIIQCGVSSQKCTSSLLLDENGSALASLYKRHNIEYAEKIKIDLIRLDDFIREHNFSGIDLLKLDVEGHEMESLIGLGDYWCSSFVKMIQFEYGGCNIDSRIPLKNFFHEFEKRGYGLAKIMPYGLAPIRYKPWLETYENSNFVAYKADLF